MTALSTSVERYVERREDVVKARELTHHLPKSGLRRHRYIDRLAHDVRRNRLDAEVFTEFMEIIDHVRY